MTTVSLCYFEERSKIVTFQLNEFYIWCKTQHILSLTEWMSENSIDIHEIYAAGLIDFTEALGPVGITPYSSIRIIPIEKEVIKEYTKDGLIDLYDSQYKFYYVTDRSSLEKRIEEYQKKSALDKRKKYINYYEHRYGSKPTPLDSELPFEKRSYVVGPFCNITHTEQKNNLDHCSWCGAHLLAKPTFLIGNNKLCYRCAKIGYQYLLKKSDVINRLNRFKLYKYKQISSKWNSDYQYHLRRKDFLTILYELITGNKDKYAQKYLSTNPKPTCFHPYKKNPSLTMIHHKNSQIIKNPRDILKRDKHKCQLCGSGCELEVHHIQPKSKGGRNQAENLITLCKICHDNEYWFGHYRAYKTQDSEFYHEPPNWKWELKPDLLTKQIRVLISEGNLFDDYKILSID